MKIILVNTNPMVAKLVEVAAKKTGLTITSYANTDEVDMDALGQSEQKSGQNYFVFIDEESLGSDNTRIATLAKSFPSCLIYSKIKAIKSFAHLVKKPFLPLEITDILQAELLKVGQDLDNAGNVTQDEIATPNEQSATTPPKSIAEDMPATQASVSAAQAASALEKLEDFDISQDFSEQLELPSLPSSFELGDSTSSPLIKQDDIIIADETQSLESTPENAQNSENSEAKDTDNAEMNFLEDGDIEELDISTLDTTSSVDTAIDSAIGEFESVDSMLDSALDGLSEGLEKGLDEKPENTPDEELKELSENTDNNINELDSSIANEASKTESSEAESSEVDSSELDSIDLAGLDDLVSDNSDEIGEVGASNQESEKESEQEAESSELESLDFSEVDSTEIDSSSTDESSELETLTPTIQDNEAQAQETQSTSTAQDSATSQEQTEILPHDEIELVKSLLNEQAESQNDDTSADMLAGDSADLDLQDSQDTPKSPESNEIDSSEIDSIDLTGLDDLASKVSDEIEKSDEIGEAGTNELESLDSSEVDSVKIDSNETLESSELDSSEADKAEASADIGALENTGEIAQDGEKELESDEFADIGLDDLAQIDEADSSENETIEQIGDQTDELDSSAKTEYKQVDSSENASADLANADLSEDSLREDFLQLSESEICEALGEELPESSEIESSEIAAPAADEADSNSKTDSSENASEIESSEVDSTLDNLADTNSDEISTDEAIADMGEKLDEANASEASETESSEIAEATSSELDISSEPNESNELDTLSDLSESSELDNGALELDSTLEVFDETLDSTPADTLDEANQKIEEIGEIGEVEEPTTSESNTAQKTAQANEAESSESNEIDSMALDSSEMDSSEMDSISLESSEAESSDPMAQAAQTAQEQTEQEQTAQESINEQESQNLTEQTPDDLGAFGAGLEAINALRDEMHALNDLDPFDKPEIIDSAPESTQVESAQKAEPESLVARDSTLDPISVLHSMAEAGKPTQANKTQAELFSELLAHKSPQEIRSLLNGAQISINISFSDKTE